MTAPAPGQEPGNRLATLELIATIVAPLSLAIALLYYFGLMRSASFYAYFGVEESALGFTTVDYVRQSIDVLASPLIIFGGATLALLIIHAGFNRVATDDTVSSGTMMKRIVGVGTVSASLVLAAIVLPWPLYLQFPLIAIGLVLLEYLAAMIDTYRAKVGKYRFFIGFPLGIRRGLAALVVAVLLLVMSADVAKRQGQELARDFLANTAKMPYVTVYSEKELQISGPGVQAFNLDQLKYKNAAYHYRYTGLRLLARPPKKWVILPAGWTRNEMRAFVLEDSKAMRVDFGAVR
ncbi:hypothetical protein [Nonomuraea sp. SBT364]|uniref:hypothetical protein n=1 Tax=Nonomuraea sp. SBT364 TaxID=1580530 RepID=UPI00066BC0D4|nr:hypothetical protein [Nonomuraea sp. SBT364]